MDKASKFDVNIHTQIWQTIFAVLSFFVASIAMIIAIDANNQSREANVIAEQANDVAHEANDIGLKQIPTKVELLTTNYELINLVDNVKYDDFSYSGCNYLFKFQNNSSEPLSLLEYFVNVSVRGEDEITLKSSSARPNEETSEHPEETIGLVRIYETNREISYDDLEFISETSWHRTRPVQNVILNDSQILEPNQSYELFFFVYYETPYQRIFTKEFASSESEPVRVNFIFVFSNGDKVPAPEFTCNYVEINE